VAALALLAASVGAQRAPKPSALSGSEKGPSAANERDTATLEVQRWQDAYGRELSAQRPEQKDYAAWERHRAESRIRSAVDRSERQLLGARRSGNKNRIEVAEHRLRVWKDAQVRIAEVRVQVESDVRRQSATTIDSQRGGDPANASTMLVVLTLAWYGIFLVAHYRIRSQIALEVTSGTDIVDQLCNSKKDRDVA
jgi:hypothetical protein